jgi:hypothetical protein
MIHIKDHNMKERLYQNRATRPPPSFWSVTRSTPASSMDSKTFCTLKVGKSEKIGRFSVQNSIFEIWKKNNENKAVFRIIAWFFTVVYSKFKF